MKDQTKTDAVSKEEEKLKGFSNFIKKDVSIKNKNNFVKKPT